MHRTATARQRARLLPPGRLTLPRAVRRARVPGGARSSDRLGRMSGSRECWDGAGSGGLALLTCRTERGKTRRPQVALAGRVGGVWNVRQS